MFTFYKYGMLWNEERDEHITSIYVVLVLCDIYRIDIECELNINYEYPLKPTPNDIDKRYRTKISPNISAGFQISSCIQLQYIKNL